MYTLDASIGVRTLDSRDPFSADCGELLQRLRARAIPVIVPLLVLPEVAGAISRAHRDPMRARVFILFLRTLPNLTLVPIDEALAEQATEIAADARLRGADAIYVAVARRYGTTLVTLDTEQRTRVATIVAALTPQEASAQLSCFPRRVVY
jgi:predicted nucleic acid-binding protein